MSGTTKAAWGFTLIELLIVVAIIAILAAIAVPNFLEAQTRAKVTRAKSDFRTLATALEAYHADNTKYPVVRRRRAGFDCCQISEVCELSTPVAYVTSTNMRDPFGPSYLSWNGQKLTLVGYDYEADIAPEGPERLVEESRKQICRKWLLRSWGPNRQIDGLDLGAAESPTVLFNGVLMSSSVFIYDPTNGTVSFGDIGRVGGSTAPRAVDLLNK